MMGRAWPVLWPTAQLSFSRCLWLEKGPHFQVRSLFIGTINITLLITNNGCPPPPPKEKRKSFVSSEHSVATVNRSTQLSGKQFNIMYKEAFLKILPNEHEFPFMWYPTMQRCMWYKANWITIPPPLAIWSITSPLLFFLLCLCL